jgi:hypothetical protein
MQVTKHKGKSSAAGYTIRQAATGLVLASTLFIAAPDRAADIAVKTPSAVVVVNAQNLFDAIHDGGVMLGLVTTREGRELLANARDPNGMGALEEAVSRYENVALELIKTEAGRTLLANGAEPGGASTLDLAVVAHSSVSFELIKTRAGRDFLSNSKDSKGLSALKVAVAQYPEVLTRLKQMLSDMDKELLKKD